jgi:hypothetical protein
MTYTGFFFEANAIQSYILLGGRLRDIVGASHLLDQLCTTDIDQACAQLNLTPVQHEPRDSRQILFTRKASGAIYAVLGGADAASELAALWSLWVRQRCPGLSFNQALHTGTTVFEVVRDGTRALGHARSLPVPALPVAPPLAERSPRTGLPAVSRTGVRGQSELVDSAVAARRQAFSSAQQDSHHKLLPQAADGQRCTFPVNLEYDPETPPDTFQFPFADGNRALGILHADGNGLGQVLLRVIEQAEKDPQQAGQQFASFLPALSEAVAQATTSAARQAAADVLLPHAQQVPGVRRGSTVWVLPARPIVLAGDDLTIILRADVAFEFADAFATRFEEFTRIEFAALRQQPFAKPFLQQLPQALTACAGLQFVKNNFPFAQALHLAEDLCSAAKKQAKEGQPSNGQNLTPATLSFHRMTTSLSQDGDAQALPGLGTYATGASAPLTTAALPRLHGLLELARELQQQVGLSSGPMRRLLNLATTDPAEAQTDYLRWRQLTDKVSPQALRSFDALLARVHPAIDPNAFPGLRDTHHQQPDRWVLTELMTVMATLPSAPASTDTPTTETSPA